MSTGAPPGSAMDSAFVVDAATGPWARAEVAINSPARPAPRMTTGSGILRALTSRTSVSAQIVTVGQSISARLPRTYAAPAIAPVAAAVTPATNDLICGPRAQRR